MRSGSSPVEDLCGRLAELDQVLDHPQVLDVGRKQERTMDFGRGGDGQVGQPPAGLSTPFGNGSLKFP